MKSIASHHQEPRLGRLGSLLVVLAAGGLVSGCSVTAAPPSPTATATPSPSPSASTQASASPTPQSTPAPLSSIGTAPAGTWSGIQWIAAGAVFPQTPVPSTTTGDWQVSLFGWSQGYVGFRTAFDDSSLTQAPTVDMVSTASADGLHWTAGRPIDIEGLTDVVDITAVLEGPSGLLAVGYHPPTTCGGPSTVEALWTSPDGLTWTRVQSPAFFTSASVYTVDAGSTGYIASGTLKDGVTQAVWLSADGRSWRQVALTKATFGNFVVDGATDFAAGYVISGTVASNGGCGGEASVFTPSLWWSANGTSWTRSKLTGAGPASDAWVTVNRISDHALMAIASRWDDTSQTYDQLVWVTSDGRTWNVVKSPSTMLSTNILTNGQRGLLVLAPSDDNGPPTIATVGDDLTVTTLNQTGGGPVGSSTNWASWMPFAAFGPTGVVILSSDGLNLWLGVPTAS